MDAADSAASGDAPGRYQFLDFNSPLSNERADRLAASLAADVTASGPGGTLEVLDVGCGWGELLLRILAAAPDSTGTGVDTDPASLARGRANAVARGLAGRVEFVHADAADASASPAATADVVVCVGASHAYGGTADALRVLRRLVRPGGRLLFGEGFWERPPTAEQAAGLGPDVTPEEFTDLAGLVDLAVAAGFRPLRISSANRDEWEEFESGYLLDWEDWLVRHADHPDAAHIRARADDHRTGWLRGYRDTLGFAYLTLSAPTLHR